jgi:DNA-binding transcriptional LysR family regulator
MRFLISSQECELLLAFECKSNLQELSELFNKDISVLSRNLKSIAKKSDLLEKQHGRWVLTDKGKALNAWSREAMYSQRLSLERQKSLKIAATREFASRILLPQARGLIGDEDISVSIISSDAGIERLILAGQADFGFDCGRPYSPSIAFKRIVRERFVTIAAPIFIERSHIADFSNLKDKDHLRFMRNEGAVWDLDVEASHYFGTFSDMASLREACKLGFGWAVIPYYAVKKELNEGSLVEVLGKEFADQKFGVWWLRERKNIAAWVERAAKWLEQQELC